MRFGDLEEDEELEKEATAEKKEAAAEKQTAKKASTEKTAEQKAEIPSTSKPTPTTEIPQEEQIESEGRKEKANVSSEEGAKPNQHVSDYYQRTSHTEPNFHWLMIRNIIKLFHSYLDIIF